MNGDLRKSPARVEMPPKDKLLVSRGEVAHLLSISERSVDYLVATKRLSARRIGTRVLIPMEEVRRFSRSDHPERMAG
jgi:excisionase family DNA binding protein